MKLCLCLTLLIGIIVVSRDRHSLDRGFVALTIPQPMHVLERKRPARDKGKSVGSRAERPTSPNQPPKAAPSESYYADSNDDGRPPTRSVDLNRLTIGVTMAFLCLVGAGGGLFYLIVIHERKCNTKG